MKKIMAAAMCLMAFIMVSCGDSGGGSKKKVNDLNSGAFIDLRSTYWSSTFMTTYIEDGATVSISGIRSDISAQIPNKASIRVYGDLSNYYNTSGGAIVYDWNITGVPAEQIINNSDTVKSIILTGPCDITIKVTSRGYSAVKTIHFIN
jgi:hypothetical protein